MRYGLPRMQMKIRGVPEVAFKKIAFLESVFEGAAESLGDGKDDNFDADVAIATGELRKLIPDLLEALGGEVVAA